MKNEPLFSILIANYNNGDYLMAAVNSVFDQDYPNWEIIIVDDVSTDNSSAVYESLNDNKKIKIYYNDTNKGCGYTKNRCINEANGEICAFLDPDDVLEKNALAKMAEVHKNHPSASIVYSRFYACDESLNILSESESYQVEPNDPYFFNFNGIISHFSSFKKDFYLRTEGINIYLKRAVDQDLYLKLYDSGGDAFYLDEVLYYYRIHNRGISTFDNIDKAFFWHWVVIIHTAKRRNINVEELFFTQFTLKRYYYDLSVRYKKLKKYEKLNNFLSGIRKKLFLKK